MDPPSRAILVLDGGFTALSQLLILAEIWRRLRYDLKREIPAPFAVFNLIVGSGAGGDPLRANEIINRGCHTAISRSGARRKLDSEPGQTK